LSGKLAEYQLANVFRSKKRFALSEFFQNVTDNTELNIIEVKERIQFQRQDGKLMEVDIAAISDCGRIVLVEVKKTKAKTGINIIEDFQEKVEVYQELNSNNVILSGFFSLGGFTDEAIGKCNMFGIAMAEDIELFS
jgi:RecB family endonuclease NucS